MQARAKAELKASGTATKGFKYKDYLRFGVEYRVQWGDMRVIQERKSSFESQNLEINLKGSAEATITVVPELTLKLW